MLKPPTRPRAPSAATLRVLYQLAYISSGAAVGIGALCAEERRRRTQIVQKIADNARRLRQSPRYAHGAAAAAVKQRDFEDNFGWFDQGTANGSQTQAEAEADSAKNAKLESQGGVKMPELPSVVEEEYGRLIEGNRKKSKRRKRNDRPDFVEEHGNREPVTKAEVDARGDRQTRTTPTTFNSPKTLHLRQAYSRDGIASKEDAKNMSWYWMSYKRPTRYGIPQEGDLKAEFDRRKPFHATKKGRTYDNPYHDYDTIIKSFDTHRLWDGQRGRTISSETLARDVDIFFDKVGPGDVIKMSKRHALQIANQLLRLSLDSGVSIKAIQSLLLWKMSVDELSIDDLYNAAASFQQIARKLEPEKTMQFYGDLFATRLYQRAGAVNRLSVMLRLHAEALELDTLDGFMGLYEQLTESVKKPSSVRHYQLAEMLERECGRLLDRGHLEAAVKLWCMSMSERKYSSEYSPMYSKTADRLFHAAITARRLSLCAQVLRVKDRNCEEDISHQADTLIRVCFEEGAIGMLRELFAKPRESSSQGGLKNIDSLSSQSYAHLCRCFDESIERFSHFYRKLPVELRASVAGDRIAAGASALKTEWNSTRNLDHVRPYYEDRLRQLDEYPGIDARPLHIAMIEVELSANQPVEAIAALSKLHESGTDGSIATLTALALAKQKNWLAFGRLFEALRQDTTELHWTLPMKRAYNNALHLFARSHTAEQLSDFVSMSINDLRFTPNQSTWEILMSALVSKKAVMQLQRWIDFSGTASRKARVNAGVAAALMKTWYLDSRHSHVLVIWFCRSLVQAAPALRGEGLLNIVRETIAFDLRKLHGVNAPWMGPILRARQALYQQLSDTVPKPGYIWNGQLYDNGKLMTAGDPMPQSLAIQDADALSTLSDTQTLEYNGEIGPVSAVETWTSDKHDEAHDVSESAEPYESPAVTEVTTDREADAVATSVSEPHPFEFNFADLRPSYEVRPSDETSPFDQTRATSASEVDTTLELSEVETLERQMVLQLSCQEYDSVLEMYRNSLDAAGLPASPLVLEIAVDASLRINGDRHEAESMMSAAREAGMNVTCAMGALLIDQLRHTPVIDNQSASRLRSDVIEYYRMNELNGLHVKHHFGIHTAHTLIQAGYAQNGINLMTTILQSTWSADKPLDIVAMGVWLSGYASLGHVRGMDWVIKEVLHQRMNIDQGFLRALKRARRPVHRRVNGEAVYVKQEPNTVAHLRHWYDVCSRRREAQMLESKVFGRKLVRLLASAANREVPRTTTTRRDRRRRLLRSERSDRMSAPPPGEKRDLGTWKPFGSPESSEYSEPSELLEVPVHSKPSEQSERPEHLEQSEQSERSEHPESFGGSEQSERSSLPLSGDLRTRKAFGIPEPSERSVPSERPEHSSPSLSDDQHEVKTRKPFGME